MDESIEETALLLQSDLTAEAGLAHVDLATRRAVFEAFDQAPGAGADVVHPYD